MPPTEPPENSPSITRATRRRKREAPQLDLWSNTLEPSAKRETAQPVAQDEHAAHVAVRGTDGTSPVATETAIGRTTPQRTNRPGAPHIRTDLAIDGTAGAALTRRQEHLLDHLRARVASGARPPTLAELCAELGLVSRGSLHKQVTALIEAGLVEPMMGKQRGVRLRRPAETKESRLPLLGRIDGAGRLRPLGRYESLTVPSWLGPDAEGFMLTVEGTRWAHLGVVEGDLLVIAARAQPAESDVVAILIDDEEYLLGRLRHDVDVLVIESDAPPAPTRRVMASRAQVQGVVRGLMRRLHHG